jgi:hypothetical protein
MITLREKQTALKILWRIPFDWVPKGLNSLRQKDKDFHLLKIGIFVFLGVGLADSHFLFLGGAENESK